MNKLQLKNGTYLTDNSIIHNKNTLNNLIFDKLILHGARDKYYLLARFSNLHAGSGSSGALTLFCSNSAVYDDLVPVIYTVNCKGECGKTSLTSLTTTHGTKTLLVYQSDKFYYVFLYAPNYHDNWDLYLVNGYSISEYYYNYAMTLEEFETYVSNLSLTKVSEI